MNGEKERILRRTPLFRWLDEGSLAKLAAHGRMVRFARGEVIFRQGDPCPGTFAVSSGAVRVYKTSAGGKEHLLHYATAGATFAEVATIGGFDCPAHAEAATETVCVLLPKQPFLEEIQRDARLCFELMRGLAGWVLHLVGLMEDIVLRDAAGRLARHLLDYPELERSFHLSMLKKDLASHLNLTGETLSRSLRRLADSGAIQITEQSKIRILDRSRLESVAEGSSPSF